MDYLSIEVYEARRKSPFAKLLPWLLGLAAAGLAAALIVCLTQSAKHKAGFLGQFYGKLSEAKAQVEALSEAGTPESLTNAVLSLTALDTVMEDGRRFVVSGIHYNYQAGGFDDIAQTMLSGMEYNGKVLCKGFLEDGALSASEKEYLDTLGNDLGALQESLTKNKQADTGLSVKTFNEKTHVFFSKYSDVLSLKLSN